MQRSRGVSIVELMVGMALGLIVVLVASGVFIGSRQANRGAEALSRTQDSARNAFELMARDLREAGGTPCDSAKLNINVLNNAQLVPPTWWVDWDNVLQGFEAGTGFAGAAVGTAVGERVAGTDAVMAKYIADLTDLTVVTHNAASTRFTVNNDPHRVSAGDLLMACSYGQSAVFQASSVGAGTIDHADSAAASGNSTKCLGMAVSCVAPLSYTFAPGSKIGRLVAVGWYIGNNGRADSGGRSLYRVNRNGAEEVVDGVSDLQLEYLRSGTAAYTDASGVTDWGDVVAVRVTLTMQGTQTGVSLQAGGRLTRPVSFTLSVRNRQP